MNLPGPKRMPEFDSFAENYDDALAQGLSVTGEDKEFFACGRINWLARCLHRYGITPASILDYGCGTGASVAGLWKLPGVQRVVGVDVSPRSLAVARRDAACDSRKPLLPPGQQAGCDETRHC